MREPAYEGILNTVIFPKQNFFCKRLVHCWSIFLEHSEF